MRRTWNMSVSGSRTRPSRCREDDCFSSPKLTSPRPQPRRWARVGYCLLLTAGLIAGMAAESRGETIRVVYTDGRDPERIAVWPVEGGAYLSVNDVGRIFGATKQWNSETKQMVMRYEGGRATLTVESPVVLVGDEAYQILSPVRLRRGVLQVPLDLVTRVLAQFQQTFTEWDPETGTLRVGREGVNVGPLRLQRVARGVRAVLTLAEPLEYSVDSEAVGGFKLKLLGGKAKTEEISTSLPRSLIKRVSATQLEDGVEILFVSGESDLEMRVITGRDPDRVVIDITKPERLSVPEPRLKPRWALTPDEVLSRDREGWTLDLVVVDPGHGGVDSGARGASGLEEKDVVLDVARRLEIMLEERGDVEAVLTRERDEFVPLRSRTEMANALDADLFVSIHCNASTNPAVSGFEVYFQSLEMGEEEQLVAEFENAVLALEGEAAALSREGDIPFILWDLAQNAFMAESSELAEMAQEALDSSLPTRNRGVKQANFVVLRGAYMPAILVEGAFATNESEEARLRSPQFREALAEGLFLGIMQFKARNERTQ